MRNIVKLIGVSSNNKYSTKWTNMVRKVKRMIYLSMWHIRRSTKSWKTTINLTLEPSVPSVVLYLLLLLRFYSGTCQGQLACLYNRFHFARSKASFLRSPLARASGCTMSTASFSVRGYVVQRQGCWGTCEPHSSAGAAKRGQTKVTGFLNFISNISHTKGILSRRVTPLLSGGRL